MKSGTGRALLPVHLNVYSGKFYFSINKFLHNRHQSQGISVEFEYPCAYYPIFQNVQNFESEDRMLNKNRGHIVS
jgi:hypothetical protein